MADRPGFVYLMHEGMTYYKIGASIDPKRRLSELMTGAASWISIVHVIPVYHMKHAERVLHQRFASKRTHNEWFSLTPDDVMWFRNKKGSDIDLLVWIDQFQKGTDITNDPMFGIRSPYMHVIPWDIWNWDISDLQC